MKKFLIVLLCLGLVGCATSQQTPTAPIKNSEIINQSFDKVWNATIATISEKGFLITTSDKNSGLVSTQPIELQGGFNIPSRIKRVAYFPYAVVPFNQARYALNVVVAKQSDELTKITITPRIEGYNYEKWIVFQSNGVIEQEIIEVVKNKL